MLGLKIQNTRNKTYYYITWKFISCWHFVTMG